MKEKIKRILDLVRSGKLTLEDAGPLLAALNARLALQTSDRELLDSLLQREDLESAQVAEHLMLLRGLKETPPAPPSPPRPPFPFENDLYGDKYRHEAREQARAAREQARQAARGFRTGGIEGIVERITDTVERAVETAMEGVERTVSGTPSYQYTTNTNRVLKIELESNEGDEYNANLPLSLAGHLDKLIPPYGLKALERAGFTVQGLQLLIEADPPSGNLIEAEDNEGNSIRISIK